MHWATSTAALSFPHSQLTAWEAQRWCWWQQLSLCQGMPSCNQSFVAASRNISPPTHVPWALFQVLIAWKGCHWSSFPPCLYLLAELQSQENGAASSLCHQGYRGDRRTRILPLGPATSLPHPASSLHYHISSNGRNQPSPLSATACRSALAMAAPREVILSGRTTSI